jgi:membrane associated rhomboid family serine protease
MREGVLTAAPACRAWGTWTLFGALVVAAALPEPAQRVLELDAGRLIAGEGWRAITGHVVHYGWGHLLRDALPLLAGALWVEARGRTRVMVVLGAAAAASTAAVVLLEPQPVVYRGSSALGAALVAAAAADALLTAGARRRCRVAAGGVLGLLGAKLASEAAWGRSVVETVGNVSVSVWAHAAGVAAGLLIAGTWHWGRRAKSTPWRRPQGRKPHPST